MDSFFNFNLVLEYFPKILASLPTTLMIVFVASVIGLILGVLIAFVRIERIPVLNQVAQVFVSFVRGTPILVQMFVVYYGLPELMKLIYIDISGWDKLYFIYITYGLNTAAFQSETIRAAILSVPANQREACAACGFTTRQTYLKVIIPQAVRVAIPNIGTTTVSLLQDTSLAFTLGVIDVVGRAKALGAVSFHTLEGYVDAAVIFIVLSFVLGRCFGLLEEKMDFVKVEKAKRFSFKKIIVTHNSQEIQQ